MVASASPLFVLFNWIKLWMFASLFSRDLRLCVVLDYITSSRMSQLNIRICISKSFEHELSSLPKSSRISSRTVQKSSSERLRLQRIRISQSPRQRYHDVYRTTHRDNDHLPHPHTTHHLLCLEAWASRIARVVDNSDLLRSSHSRGHHPDPSREHPLDKHNHSLASQQHRPISVASGCPWHTS